jgi:phage gp16-like protein
MELIQGGAIANTGEHNYEAARKALLAKVHIAKKDLKWPDDYYRQLLMNSFGVPTAAALGIRDLEFLIETMIQRGWKPKARRGPGSLESQADALRHRARDLASKIKNGEAGLRGLSKKICGVEVLDWCDDIAKLKRLLAILGNIYRREQQQPNQEKEGAK